MNYGIAENRILAGVVADSLEPTSCEPKSGYDVVVPDKKEKPINDGSIECVYATTVEYFKNVYGTEVTIVIEVTDLATGLKTVEYCTSTPPADYKSLACKAGKMRTRVYALERIICGEGKSPGSCCYPKEAEKDCSKLIRATT